MHNVWLIYRHANWVERQKCPVVLGKIKCRTSSRSEFKALASLYSIIGRNSGNHKRVNATVVGKFAYQGICTIEGKLILTIKWHYA
jgi:hypothetical protein